MKKFFMYLLIFSLSIVAINTVYSHAEKSIYSKELEEVILLVKDKYEIGEEYDKFKSNINSSEDVRFNLNWSSSKDKNLGISILTDRKGNIISYYENMQLSGNKSTLRIDEAKKIGEDFIEFTDPKAIAEIKLDMNNRNLDPTSTEYNFSYIRNINGVYYRNNTVNISVNKENKKVSNYYINWDRTLPIENKEDLIGKYKAKEIYKEKISLTPVYRRDYNNSVDGIVDYTIVYKPRYENKYIHGKTGDILDRFEEVYPLNATREDAVASKGLTEEELMEIDKLKGIVSKEEINEYILEHLPISNNYSIVEFRLESDYYNRDGFIWDVNYKFEDDVFYHVRIDGLTKEIISYNKSRTDYSYDKLENKKNEKLAWEIISDLGEDKLKELEYISSREDTYFFQRKVNGIFVEDNYVSILIDEKSKELISYNSLWHKGEFPSKDDLITIDRAYDILFNEVGFELEYIKTYNEKNVPDAIKLVYKTSDYVPNFIRASDGKIVHYSGEEYKKARVIKYDDLDLSYAKEKIEILGENGIGFISKSYKPKEQMKEIDFLYILYQAKNPYSNKEIDEDKMIKYFIDNGYIENGNGLKGKYITKEVASKYIVIAMGYGEIGSLKNIFSNEYRDGKDIEKSLLGYLNIAKGLNIISESEGNISPKKILLREDGANLIYNYLFR